MEGERCRRQRHCRGWGASHEGRVTPEGRGRERNKGVSVRGAPLKVLD